MSAFPLGSRVSLEDLEAVARDMRPVRLGRAARVRMARARGALLGAAAAGPVYGVNTGFGELASRRIAPEQLRRLQYNLVRSHACGVGEPLSPEQSRAMLFLRANELARGHSGCRPELAAALASLLNRGVAPLVPSRGSVGASGDLAPQAHAALVVIGEGRARLWGGKAWGRPLPGGAALRRARVRPVALEAKEGLSLINGTQAMQAVGGLALARALRVLDVANLAGAASLEGIMGTPAPFDPALARLKPHPGQRWAASCLRRLLRGSGIREAHRRGDPRVQDAYSLRCMPQVHGAVRDALGCAVRAVGIEMASVTDNPVVVAGRVLSGGNFHGQALALAFDHAAVALAALGGVSERRIFQLTLGQADLPPFLARAPGLESGYMIPQVVAAAVAAENKGLAHPASADSIPTCADKEDFVSMGMGAALKLSRVVEGVAQILGIELLAAARAVELRRPLRPGVGVARGLARLRGRVPAERAEEPLGSRMERVKGLILDGFFAGVI